VAQKQIHTATNPSIVIARFIVFSWFNCTQHAMPDLKSAFVPLILSHPLSRRIFNHFNDAASTAIVKNVLFFYICLWSLTSEPLAQLSRRGWRRALPCQETARFPRIWEGRVPPRPSESGSSARGSLVFATATGGHELLVNVVRVVADGAPMAAGEFMQTADGAPRGFAPSNSHYGHTMIAEQAKA
jgi:hypothetical protein